MALLLLTRFSLKSKYPVEATELDWWQRWDLLDEEVNVDVDDAALEQR